MNRILSFFYGVFAIGFALKFFHVHYNAIVMLVALGGIFVIGTIGLFTKSTRIESLVHLGSWAWLSLLLICLKFLPFGFVALILACLLSIAGAMAAIRDKKLKQMIGLGFCMLLALSFYIMPTSSRYHLVSIRWNYEIDHDFESWDKYSWFLYQNGHYLKAREASDKAKKIALEKGEKEKITLIEGHNQAIKDKTWERYH